MDIEMWLNFYRKWKRDMLIREIGNCHKFERKLLLDCCGRTIAYETAYNLMVQCQTRQNIIFQIIEEKSYVKEDKSNRES